MSEPPSRLELSPEEMRALGYRAVDRIVDHLTVLPDAPVRSPRKAKLELTLPEHPTAPETVLDQVTQELFSTLLHVQHPRFFAYIPGPSNFVSVLADALVAGFNPFAGTWQAARDPARLELATLDWLRELCGFPSSGGGLFLSGGSAANLTGLAVARQTRLGEHSDNGVVYLSDQTHSSIERALRVLGFTPEQVRRLAADDECRLPTAALAEAIAGDRAAGGQPFCVVANAGTTSTGAVDPLPALADLCRREGMWLHVDGAYGATAALCERGREALTGLGEADSLTLDPHKWLFQPFELGCLLVRDRRLLHETFHILPDYLKDTALRGDPTPPGTELIDDKINFGENGVQLTRSFRALKLWMSLKIFGKAAFRQAVEHGFELADLAQELIEARPAWQLVTPSQLAIVSFRYAPPGLDEEAAERINQELPSKLEQDGFAYLSSTRLRGQTVLRLCTINPRTTPEDLRRSLERAEELAAASPSPLADAEK